MRFITQFLAAIQGGYIAMALLGAVVALTIPIWAGFGSGVQATPALFPDASMAAQTSPAPTVESDGVAWHGAEAWHNAGYKGRKTGTGGRRIKVGIIDGGFEGFSSLMMRNELPADTRVKRKCYAVGSSDSTANIADCEHNGKHGTGVAEIIIDMAPEVELYISNPPGENQLMETVLWMDGQGVDVINQSIGWGYSAPGDGTYRVASTASHALKAIGWAVDVDSGTVTLPDGSMATPTGGALWVNAAGNNALSTWTGPFVDSYGSNGTHDYVAQDVQGNDFYDEGNDVYLTPGEPLQVDLRWQDQWGYEGNTDRNSPGADCDLQLSLFRSVGSRKVRVPGSGTAGLSNGPQSGGLDHIPYETIDYTIPKPAIAPAVPATPAPYHIYISRSPSSTCAAPPTAKPDTTWLQLYASVPLEHTSDGHHMSIPEESTNPGMLAVGAAKHEGMPDRIIIYNGSSRGPDLHNYPDGRTKPNVTGLHCVRTVSYPTFCGTSVAAPHIAGLAALVLGRELSKYENQPGKLANYLKDNAVQRGTPDPNNAWGEGFVYLSHPTGTASFSVAHSVIPKGQGRRFAVSTNVAFPPGVQVKVSPGSLSLSPNCSSSTSTPLRSGAGVIVWGCSETRNGKVWIYDGNTLLQTRTVVVPPDASLSGLTISPGSLVETFTSSGTRYTAQVDNNISRITVTPTTTTPGATIKVNGSSTNRAVALIVGANNRITIEVAATGYTTRTYTITVTRARPTPVASLSALTLSEGTLAPVFASGTTAYTAQVANNISSVTITPTTTTPGATIRVGTSTVSSGSASGAVSLIAGRNNRITITVSAAGYTTRTYTITVTRAAAPLRPPTNLSLSTVSGHTDRLELTYTRSPETIHRYEFELHYLNKLTGKDVRYKRALDSRSPETFRSVGRGYWYKARGRNCRNTSQADTCGVWSDWSSQVELSNPSIAISGLTGSYIAGDTDPFSVTLSDLTLDQPYTVTLASSQGSVIGFNFQCSYLPSKSFTPLDNSHTVYFTLHACQIPGTTVTAQSGTVTAKLWKGSAGASGGELETATANATVTKASGGLSPVPSAITVGQDLTFTVTTNVPNSAGVYITATLSGDVGRTALPPLRNCYYASSGFAVVNGNTITLRGCRAGKTRLTLSRSNSIIQLASYTINVAASDTKLSPPPATFTAGHDQTFTLSTDLPSNARIYIAATQVGDSGQITLPPTRGCYHPISGLDAANGNTLTIRGCKAGTATLNIYWANAGVLLKSYTVTVNASNTKLSPTPAAFTAGHDQTFTLTTDIANNPGVYVTATVAGDPGQITLPPTRGCYHPISGLSAVNGNTLTIRGCRAGRATITIYRSNSGVLLKSYTVTVNASNTSLSPTPAAFTIGTNQTFTLTTDIANTPGVWVGLNYNSADTGRLVLPNQDCSVSSAGTAAVNGSSITLKPCTAGSVTIMVNRSNSGVTLVSYPVTVNSS